MSFILDALRKSEHSRDKQILPGVIPAQKSSGSARSLRWVVVLCVAIFLLNATALLYLLLREPRAAVTGSSPAAQASPDALAPASAPAAASVAPSGMTPSSSAAAAGPVRSLAEEAASGSRTAPYTDVPPTPRPRAAVSVRGAGAASITPAPSVTVQAPVEADSSTSGLPTRRQLPPTLASALPALSVDLHVYSPQAAQRFMVISGQRAVEGATVAGGVVIERITPEGAVAVFRGTRFLLTRE